MTKKEEKWPKISVFGLPIYSAGHMALHEQAHKVLQDRRHGIAMSHDFSDVTAESVCRRIRQEAAKFGGNLTAIRSFRKAKERSEEV